MFRPAIKLLAFALDGTLVDSAPGIVETVNAVLAEHGYPPAPAAEAAALFSSRHGESSGPYH